MTSFYYKARKIKEPILNVTQEQAESYGTSLSALNQAWSSVTATKKEFNTINSKIRQSTVSPVFHYNDDDRNIYQIPPFPRKDPNIERRIVYESNQHNTCRKENIPPQSYPQPRCHLANEEYFLKQEAPAIDLPKTTDNHFNVAHHNNLKVNTSLSGRSILAKEKKSKALKRLKERINQQKENSISFENEENRFPEKLYHNEDEIIRVSNEEILPPMVRKIAQAPSAPAYKGFNQPNTTFVKSTSILHNNEEKIQTKESRKLIPQKEKKNSMQVKIGKVGKKQRIIAQKKPPNVITTSTWRVGLELQKQMKKELKLTQDNSKQVQPKMKRTQFSESENIKTQASSISSESRQKNERSSLLQSESEKEQKLSNDAVVDDNSKTVTDDKTISKENSHKQYKQPKSQKSNSDEEKPYNNLDITDEEISSLKEHSMLSKNAKEILAELHKPEREKESESIDKKKRAKAVVDTGLDNRRSVHDKRSPPVKRKLDVEIFPSRKVRHYDQSEVKKYMIKQQAERKRQRLEEREKEKRQKEEQENKLKELFEKQKAAVKESSKQRRKHMFGSTFTKQKQLQDMRGNDIGKLGIKHHSMFQKFHEEHDEQSCIEIDDTYEPRSETTTSLPMPSDTGSDSDTLETYSNVNHSPDIGKQSLLDTERQDVYENAKADRVAAIRATAAALRERLNMESKRLTELVNSKKQPSVEKQPNAETSLQQNGPKPLQYPGVHNIDSQAELNVRLCEMEAAAKKIQALYRGHSVRYHLRSWQLPSGRTLHQTLEEGRRRAFLSDLQTEQPVKLSSEHRSPVRLNQTPCESQRDYDTRLKDPLPRSPVSSIISEALIQSKSLLEDAEKSLFRCSNKKSQANDGDGEFPSYNSYRGSNDYQRSTTSPISPTPKSITLEKSDPNERLRKILEKYKDVPADKYSVINIFTRNYPNLRKQQLSQELSPAGTETENLLADAYAHESKDDTSIDEYLTEQELDTDLTEHDSNDKSSSRKSTLTLQQELTLDQATKSNSAQRTSTKTSPPTQLSYRSLLSPKPKRTMSSSSDVSEKLFSPTPDTVKTKSLEEIVYKSDNSKSLVYATDEESVTSTLRSPTLFSDNGNEDVINPVLTSTKRSPSKYVKQDPEEEGTPLTHNVNFNRGDGRMSPNALERRLRAELNLFDSVGDSIQQINEMDKIRDIVQAQQETVSLAQVLKQRQLSHQQEIEKMSLEARERAAKSAQNIETAKRNAAEAAANAMKAIAEIKTKAAGDVAQSTKQLANVQNEATALSLSALKQTEQARQHAFDSYEQSVEKRLANVENVVTAAASAASGTAVEVALTHYRERLETLRKQSLKKVSDSYTTTESKSSQRSEASDSSQSYSGEISNRIITEDVPPNKQSDSKTSSKLSTPRKASDSQDDEMEGVSEDLPAATEDHELSEALFSTGKKMITSVADESIHSNYSEEKFHSSLTEDELKRDFRQVLPSENHRRKSFDRRDYIISGNETSSDEMLTPRNVGKSSLKKHSKSPFVDEDTFTRFTADMVRQYVQEEEVRSKHQAALLALREKAIMEKTKAEMAYLEMQKKSLKKKGVDEKMPPIAKKQRALMLKLEAEQDEIRRLKEAHKAARDERLFMLQQEQDIRRIQKSTRKIWNEVGSYKDTSKPVHKDASKPVHKDTSKPTSHMVSPNNNTSDVTLSRAMSAAEKDISEETLVDENLSTEELPDASISTAKDDSLISKHDDVSEEIQSEQAKSAVSASTPSASYPSKKGNRTSTPTQECIVNKEKTNEECSSVSHDLQKLKHMASKKYLTEREKKLENRKQTFSEIMERESKLKTWRRKIVEEELRLKADIKKVLHHGATNKTDETQELEHSFQDSTLTEGQSRKTKRPSSASSSAKHSEHVSDVSPKTPSSVVDDGSLISEDSVLGNQISEKLESVKSELSKSSTESKISEALSYRSETKSHTAKPVVTEQSLNNLETYAYSNTFEDLTRSNKLSSLKERKSEEDSWTEGTSDASDTEQRLKALEHELRRRRTELQKLRKKKEKENLRKKEQQLKKELQAVEQQINRESKENWINESVHTTSKVSPRVLSPRSSLDNIILPEKIKISSEKESRRSLDFSEKELDHEKTLSPGDNSSSDISASSHASKKESKLHTNEKEKSQTTVHSFEKEKSRAAHSINQAEQDSIDEITENIPAKDHSSTSTISEEVKTAKSTLIDEQSTRKSTKSLENIYDDDYDDFFESESVKDQPLSIQEELSKHNSTSSIHEEPSSISEVSSKHSVKSQSNQVSSDQTANNKSIRNTNAFDGSQSGQYSNRFVSEVDEISNSFTKSDIGEVSKSSGDNVSEHFSAPDKESEKLTDEAISTEKGISKRSPAASVVREHVIDQKSPTELSKSELSSNEHSTTSTTTAEIVQPDEFSKSNLSSVLGFRVSDRVIVENVMSGTIRYLGKTSFSPVLVAGIELDQPSGTNNGTFKGKQYFQCPEDHGLFTTIEKLKLFDEKEVAAKASSEASKSSSTLQEVDESLEEPSLKTEGSYSEDFEPASNKSQSKELTKKPISYHESLSSSISSRSVKRAEDIVKSIDELIKHSASIEKNVDSCETIDDLDLSSTSDVESLTGGEIPSPRKLDVRPLVDSITDGIMKSIISETIAVVSPRPLTVDTTDETKPFDGNHKTTIDSPTDIREKTIETEVTAEPTDLATKKLLNDALSMMFTVMKEKDDKLLEQEDRMNKHTGNDIFSVLAGDDDEGVENLKDEGSLMTNKLDHLKDVHDQLDMLLGDDDDDDDEEEEDDDLGGGEIVAPPKLIEEKLKVPINEKDTRRMVSLAIDEINKYEADMDTLSTLQIPDTISEMTLDDEELDEQSTLLYKTLVFDMTLYLYREIKLFGELQTQKRAPWLKIPRKTFSKFIRKTYVFKEDLSERLSYYVCACMDLQEGRPSLKHIKRKLPLNLMKKDYVDAVLVEELREEEAQWVNYDEDELRVKLQLADNILDSLLSETVNILSNILDVS